MAYQRPARKEPGEEIARTTKRKYGYKKREMSGTAGGQVTREKYGVEHYSKIAPLATIARERNKKLKKALERETRREQRKAERDAAKAAEEGEEEEECDYRQWRMCGNKIRYEDEFEAKKNAVRLYLRTGDKARYYRCKHCGFLHIGRWR